MSNFSHKVFRGQTYTFAHLAPLTLQVPLIVKGAPVSVPVAVTFGPHCFTETFDEAKHGDEHRYTHKGELRAFDLTRHDCSLQLPSVMTSLLSGTIYWADASYTYVAQVSTAQSPPQEAYSVFFSLERPRKAREPELMLYVKSAYLSPLKAKSNARNWRFKALVGQVSGAFDSIVNND